MKRLQRMLVGLSNTSADAELLQYVAGIVRLGATREVRFVHVAAPHESAVQESAAARMRAAVQQSFSPIPPNLPVHFDVLKGPVEDRLLATALEQEIGVIVIGHGITRNGRKSLGRRLAMKAPCSVWLAPQGAQPALKRILVPIDFSDPSADALRVAAELADLADASDLVTLHVYSDRAVYDHDRQLADDRRRAAEDMDRLVAGAATNLVTVTPLFELGDDVARTISRTAEAQRIDLVVMSSRGRSPSAAVLLGSVTEDLIIDTRGPVLVVKHFGAKMGLLRALLKACEPDRPVPQYN